MPSHKAAWIWLAAKEWRELIASRAYWVLLAAIGPLVGVAFINAVQSYAEVSGLGGTSAGVGEALSPLIGVWAPTFSACELAAVFLLPFVCIRLVAGDKQSGALKLEAQHPMPTFARISAKAFVLLAGSLIASLAPILAILLWKSYGGTIYFPELTVIAAGHILNAGLTVAFAAAAAAITDHPSTAAIVTLSITVGTWIINFVAAVQGGIWERIANFTPTAMVAEFQHGLLRLDMILLSLLLILAGLIFTTIWMRIGTTLQRRTAESLALLAVAAIAAAACGLVNLSWDESENRMNSFSQADESALRQIRKPLRIEAHLAPEDPRRTDLERKALSKLRRLLPSLKVEYIAATSIGLFEQTNAHYGEVWYDLDGRKEMSRITTAEGVLETIYGLAGITPPADNQSAFRGHPLPVPPKGAALVFYGIWPIAVIGCAITFSKRTK